MTGTWHVVMGEVEDLRLAIQTAEAEHQRLDQQAGRALSRSARAYGNVIRLQRQKERSEAALRALCERDGIDAEDLEQARRQYVEQHGEAAAS